MRTPQGLSQGLADHGSLGLSMPPLHVGMHCGALNGLQDKETLGSFGQMTAGKEGGLTRKSRSKAIDERLSVQARWIDIRMATCTFDGKTTRATDGNEMQRMGAGAVGNSHSLFCNVSWNNQPELLEPGQNQ